MGAHPKNKITRAERGKRRAGNTPSLKKDPKVVSVPLNKRGLVNSILRKIGAVSGPTQEKAEPAKKATPAAKPAPVEKAEKAPKAKSQAPKATVKRTQHKG